MAPAYHHPGGAQALTSASGVCSCAYAQAAAAASTSPWHAAGAQKHPRRLPCSRASCPDVGQIRSRRPVSMPRTVLHATVHEQYAAPLLAPVVRPAKSPDLQGFFSIGETGFEPATARPPAGCATRLRHSPWSYVTERATGIEPALEAWKASVQPQHFARKLLSMIPARPVRWGRAEEAAIGGSSRRVHREDAGGPSVPVQSLAERGPGVACASGATAAHDADHIVETIDRLRPWQG